MIVRSDTPRCGFVFSLSRPRRELDHSAIHDCCIGQSFELVTVTQKKGKYNLYILRLY